MFHQDSSFIIPKGSFGFGYCGRIDVLVAKLAGEFFIGC
jgi:hypothetical protein